MAQELEGIVFPDTPFDLRRALGLLVRSGSEAHGLYMAGSGGHDGLDDHDLTGVVVPPSSYYLGMRGYHADRRYWEVATEINGSWDVVLYELRKFVYLLMKQNPATLQTLWVEDEDYLSVGSSSRIVTGLLVANRHLFRHARRARATFVGYARGQLKRATSFDRDAMEAIDELEQIIVGNGLDLRHAAEGKLRHEVPAVQLVLDRYVGMRRTYHKAYMGAKRWEMVKRVGYDAKNAAHMVRLLHVGHEFLTTGEMRVRRDWDRQLLMEIKAGTRELRDVQEHAERYFKLVDECESVLPESIDEDEVSTLVEAILGYVLEPLRDLA